VKENDCFELLVREFGNSSPAKGATGSTPVERALGSIPATGSRAAVFFPFYLFSGTAPDEWLFLP